MKNSQQLPLFFLLIILLASLCSCVKEEDDFTKTPTATSTVVEGRVTASDGTPLVGLDVTFNYVKTVWLAGMITRHKAKCKTDKNGAFRMFFELKDDELSPMEGGVNKSFFLELDLARLRADDYIMPSDIMPDNEGTTINFYYGNKVEKGLTYTQEIVIPRKRMVEIVVPANDLVGPKDKYVIHNCVEYGGDNLPYEFYSENGKMCMTHPVELTAGRELRYSFPCAVECENDLSLRVLKGGSGAYELIGEPKKVTVTASAPESVTLDNDIVPEEACFKLQVHKDPNESFGAPFTLFTFRITDRDDKYSMTAPQFCQYYDSIVWCAEGYPDTEVVYRKGAPYENAFQSQWGSCFFQKESLQTRLDGYKNGKVIYSVAEWVYMAPRDFLNVNWVGSDISLTGGSFRAYCPLYKNASFRVDHPMQTGEHVYMRVYCSGNSGESEEDYMKRAEKTLTGLMDYHLGASKAITTETAREIFYEIKDNETPLRLWQTEKTNAVLIRKTEDGVTRFNILAEKRLK